MPPPPPSSLMIRIYYLIIVVVFFLKEMTKTLIVSYVSLYGHKSQQLSEYHPREVTSVLSLHLQLKCVVFPHTYIILFLQVLVTN